MKYQYDQNNIAQSLASSISICLLSYFDPQMPAI